MSRAWIAGCLAVLYGGLAAGLGVSGYVWLAVFWGLVSAGLVCSAVWQRLRRDRQ